MVAALVLTTAAFAQNCSGPNTVCDYASPTAASPSVTVQEGPPLTALPTATASGTPGAAVGGELPSTGGSGGLALIAAALLLGSGVLSYAILRRSP